MVSKVTFTLDDDTVRTIRRLADRSHKPQSLVVREAVAHYAAADQKTTPEERERWIRTFDELVARVPPRAAADVTKEQEDIRQSRRESWRRRAAR